jgi:hypothetical protein
MKKAKMVCPFTGGKCVECLLYRGRHYNLCFSEHFQSIKNKRIISRDLRVGETTEDYRHQIPGNLFLGTLNVMSNIEDIIVKEELGK